MKYFKAHYEKEEIDELLAWFEERMDKLPQQLRIDESNRSTNLPKTVRMLAACIRSKELTAVFCGYVSQLLTIRERLQEEGLS